MARFVLAVAAIFITYVCPAFAEDKAPNRPVPRTELVPLASLTIPDEQFLKGDANGKPRRSPPSSGLRGHLVRNL
jgi:hypothetical protein